MADEKMRKGKVMCHDLFDVRWRGKPKAQKKRRDLYSWLADKMELSVDDCHFGHFDIHQLRQAYKILCSIREKEMKYDNYGNIYFD